MQKQETGISPLGEVLYRARLTRRVTFEDAERVTRIPRRYLQALETGNFAILPAPVYARGFLRSYSTYLGLDPAQLLPLFPLGQMEQQPRLERLPEVKHTRTWSIGGGMLTAGVVGMLMLLVIGLYAIGKGSGGSLVTPEQGQSVSATQPGVERAAGGLPDMTGLSVIEGIAEAEQAGASFVLVGVTDGDLPPGQIIGQTPPAGSAVGSGDLITFVVTR